jgi:hypothetical protein
MYEVIVYLKKDHLSQWAKEREHGTNREDRVSGMLIYIHVYLLANFSVVCIDRLLTLAWLVVCSEIIIWFLSFQRRVFNVEIRHVCLDLIVLRCSDQGLKLA